MLILAGDIGGTTTRLAYFEADAGKLAVVAEKHYPSNHFPSLTEIIELFVSENHLNPEKACFGIAGPVLGGMVRTPNLPWSIDGSDLATVLGLPEVLLINDLDANAYGIDILQDEDFAVLQQGQPVANGTIAVVSAGTGLGESFAYWDGICHRPLPSEAGHADFAPRTNLETELLLYLLAEYGRVSYERVVSGPGLYNIYRFYRDVRGLSETNAVIDAMRSVDPPIAIVHAAMTNSCDLCSTVLDLFIAIYGAEAGNAALRFLATGGVYIGGGIAPRIVDKLKGTDFMTSFLTKGRLSTVLESIPVKVILNDRTALLGAGRCAGITAANKL
ncbi:glucokinase [Geobacter grbiciae]|uniref:glucokinase n=1 Tax=Geobacter grbiciae TaxID=155042 RepID=UPI001C034AD8|nr:glucokinase [Geobacter grbiciae]MBT1073998.1 glucokinase [Geobacter grbiciae]